MPVFQTHITDSSRKWSEEKQKWVEEHARRVQQLFEKWQNPLGINGSEYRKHLSDELSDCYDQPLRKSIIEKIV
ncbi:MAG: hypothetical protein MUO22_07630 [Sedimentisphaerales bacterium]|nr:hypothetical protein [Sedimentisphaerales bacterium]